MKLYLLTKRIVLTGANMKEALMDFQEMITIIQNLQEIHMIIHTGIIVFLIVLVGMIKIPKMELNLWGWLGKKIGKAINSEVLESVENLKRDLDDFKKEEELERVRFARQRILRFNDEILFGKRHSKEHFDEILDDITVYENYCANHEDYENNKAILAIGTIKEVYKQCLKTHDFLIYTKK